MMAVDHAASLTPEAMVITGFGHSCFKLSWHCYSIVLDPYDPRPGLPPLQTQAHKVLQSHDHSDHSYVQAVELLPAPAECPFNIAAFPSWHDKHQGAKRGPNTIHRFEAGGLTVIHLGDLGHTLTVEQVASWGSIDALMVPVGGYYTIDAQEAREICELMQPRVIIPMHFRVAPNQPIAALQDFLVIMEDYDIVRYSEQTIYLTANTPRHVAVLRRADPTEADAF